MKRDNFGRESEIIGNDFGGILRDYGGKTGGLILQQAIIDQRPWLANIVGISPYSVIGSALYSVFEEVVDSKGGIDIFEGNYWADVESYEKEVLTVELLALIENEIYQLLRKFQKQGVQVGRETLFHIRLSVGDEDFIDDSYYGVFGTHGGIPFFRDFNIRSKKTSFAVQAIISLFVQLYQLKQKPAYCLPKDASAGITVQLTVDSMKHSGYGITAYSSYPEVEFSDESVWELYQVPRGWRFEDSLGWAGPLTFGGFVHFQLVFDGKRMIPGYYIEQDKMDSDGSWFWYFEGRRALEKGFLTERQNYLLSRVLEEFSEALGYSVNLELWTTSPDSEFFNSVQLRPVPTLDPNRSVKKLEPLKSDEVLLAETPFVYGSFKITAPIVMPTDRSDYVDPHSFKQSVILYYDRGRDLMDFAEMQNVVALINLQEGRALQHSQEYRPSFSLRDQFYYLGLPVLHNFERYFGEEQTFEGSIRSYGLRHTPFEVTVECDGRFGRIYMKKADVEKFGVEV